MSIRGIRGIGIPVVLMHEGEGLVVTVETKSGHSYRGLMETTEDNMNVSLKDVVVTDKDGRVSKMERVFLRGSQIIFVVFPDLLGQAPMFKRVALASKGITVAGGLGRGRQAAIGAKVAKQVADATRGPPMGGPGGGPPMHGGGGGFPPPPFGGMPPPGYGGGQPPFGHGGPPPHMMYPPRGPPPQGGGFGGPPRGFEGPPGGGRGRGADMTRPSWM